MSTRIYRRSKSLATAALAAGFLGATALTGAGVAAAVPTQPTVTPFTTPNTDSCPNRSSPPPPMDASEAPAPGSTAPAPVPIPPDPVGGERMGGCGPVLPAGVAPVPADISATAWLVADLDSGKVLATKDPHGRYRPASIIKTLLATVALRHLDLNTVVVGTQEDADADGTRVGIGPGGRYTDLQLLEALLMCSGNDAAHAISAQLGGDESTVAQMNDLAKQLHALDTRTATPAGLDGPGMSTSAYDMATIFREAMATPKFADIIHTQQIDFPGYPADPRIPGDKDRPGFPIANDNRLLYDYDGDIGGKTGFTDDARQTYVDAAERNGHRLVVVLLKADVLPLRPPEQAARLLDWAFAMPAGTAVGSLPGTERSTTPSVVLATPPTQDDTTATTADHHDRRRGTFIVAGLVLVIVLVLVGWAMIGRTRRR